MNKANDRALESNAQANGMWDDWTITREEYDRIHAVPAPGFVALRAENQMKLSR